MMRLGVSSGSVRGIAKNIFDAFEGLGFDVVFQPGFYPLRDFIFRFPSDANSLWIDPAYIGKFFDSQALCFQCILKVLIIHPSPLKVNFIDHYTIRKLTLLAFLLTKKQILLYNSGSIGK